MEWGKWLKLTSIRIQHNKDIEKSLRLKSSFQLFSLTRHINVSLNMQISAITYRLPSFELMQKPWINELENFVLGHLAIFIFAIFHHN